MDNPKRARSGKPRTPPRDCAYVHPPTCNVRRSGYGGLPEVVERRCQRLIRSTSTSACASLPEVGARCASSDLYNSLRDGDGDLYNSLTEEASPRFRIAGLA